MRFGSTLRSWTIGTTLAVVPMVSFLKYTGANEDGLPAALSDPKWSIETFSLDYFLPTQTQEAEVAAEANEEDVDAVLEEEESAAEEAIAEVKPEISAPKKESADEVVRVPIFAGFEADRFQKHDALIAKYVAAFNENPAKWAGATDHQALKITRLTAAQVKSHMIQESGGADARSRAAWRKDPLQANVPGDWSSYKKYVGLHKPRNRNEGSLETNLKAGIMILARKGFSPSGQPAANRTTLTFGGWRRALQRYNGRRDLVASGRMYCVDYARRILDRAASPRVYTSIPIRKNKKSRSSRR